MLLFFFSYWVFSKEDADVVTCACLLVCVWWLLRGAVWQGVVVRGTPPTEVILLNSALHPVVPKSGTSHQTAEHFTATMHVLCGLCLANRESETPLAADAPQ